MFHFYLRLIYTIFKIAKKNHFSSTNGAFQGLPFLKEVSQFSSCIVLCANVTLEPGFSKYVISDLCKYASTRDWDVQNCKLHVTGL